MRSTPQIIIYSEVHDTKEEDKRSMMMHALSAAVDEKAQGNIR